MSKKTYYLHSYGCQMNLADSGILSASMKRAGYAAVPDPEHADIIILNTCSVREKAETRALGRLRELAHLKRNRDVVLCAVGCMAQRMGSRLVDEIPEIDMVLGTNQLFELPLLLDGKNGQAIVETGLRDDLDWAEYSPVPENPYSAHVTITRGCGNFCAYCIVPYLRGPEKHRTPDAILGDIHTLTKQGIVEITLVGQNVNSYRADTLDFPALIKLVATETDIKRIRFITSHPKDLSDDLAASFADTPKLMPHIHLPMQSGSDRVLSQMFRRYTLDHYRDRVNRLRQACPDISLTTDLIVGFPTETHDEFLQTLDAVTEIRFDAAFMFRYSIRSGTWAAKNLIDDVPEKEKLARLNRLIELQKDISFSVNQRETGKTVLVLIDGTSRRDKTVWKGKTGGNKTILFTDDDVFEGDIVAVKVTAADSWTLHGERIA